MDEELGKFAFIIQSFKQADGTIRQSTRWAHQGILPETIVMQLRAFLRGFENAYFDNFDKSASAFEQK